MLQKSLLLTKKEIQVIKKRISHKKLTQQDSNYLSRFVRPKLREMAQIDSRILLKKLEYNQKTKSIESKIISLILKNIKKVSSVTLYGSIIYSHYTNYNDIDILVSVKKRFWKKLGEKYALIKKIKDQAKKKGLTLDIKIFADKEIYESYPSNITLIYELKDSKTIYGRLVYPNKISIDNPVLNFHMDYSYFILSDIKQNGLEGIDPKKVYSAIRNLWIIRLITERIINNETLLKTLNSELGDTILNSLKGNTASPAQKKMAFIYLKDLYKKTEKIARNINKEIKWERKA